MYNNIIFIGGIHGVGKGTMCKEISRNKGFHHLSASKIIKWSDISDTKNKKVKDINITQEKLMVGLENAIKNDVKYLLDGHFCLLNDEGKIEKVSISTFLHIKPEAIIVITSDIGIVKKRLEDRDEVIYSSLLLHKMQELEVLYAKEVAEILNIPFLSIISGNYESIHEFLDNKDVSN